MKVDKLVAEVLLQAVITALGAVLAAAILKAWGERDQGERS